MRGRAYEHVTLADAYLIGRAAAQVLGGTSAVLGRDTRESGPDLTQAVGAGLEAGGVVPLDVGVVPTPAVAVVAKQRDAIGVVISASHNPWYDNGIKLFSRAGTKLSDDQQAAVEQALAIAEAPSELVPTRRADSIQRDVGDWVAMVAGSIDVSLSGLSVVLDCANGAASHVAAPALADLGADVTVLFNSPNGRNINADCGSTHPQALAAEVVATGADLGLALDGDADRLLAIDAAGAVVNGDQIMAMLARDMDRRGVLAGRRLVVTVMSNLGLLRSMREAGIEVETTPVGDRNVLIALDELDASFGGEQSGHLIFADHVKTGDGLLSGVQLLALVKRSGDSLADLAASAMTSFPQVLKNVAVAEQMPDVADRVGAAIASVEQALGDDGRVLVRASGTESVVRVMVEAADASTAEQACNELCDAVRELG